MAPGELEGIPVPFERLMSELEMNIMEEVVRAIKINGFSTSTADYQMYRLIQLGKSEGQIKKWVQEALDVSQEEIDKVFSDTVYEHYYGYERAYKLSGLKQIPIEKNKELMILMAAVRSQTSDTFRNITASMGFAVRNPATGKIDYTQLMEFYQNTLDDAVMSIASGAISYDKALSKAVNTMTTSGIRWVNFESGYHSRIDVAARNAIMTGFRQVQGKINEQVAKDLGTDSYEVTYHIGARPTHQPWQGKVWTYEQLKSVCGLGTVTGLHGAKCYHDYNAFIPGVSVRTYTDEQLAEMMEEENTPKSYNGKEYTTYEALQEQRKMERNMRKTRQDIKLLQDGDADEETVILKQARYQLQQQQYKAFSKAMKMPEQKQRVYQDGLGKIGGRGRIKGKSVAKKSDSDIMKLPRYKDAVIPKAKFTQYALNPAKDSNKAKAFEKALGYTMDNADELIEQIYARLPDFEAIAKGDKGWGMTYEVVMEIQGINGKTAKVLTGWIDDKNNGEMRLTTVHIDR